MNPITIEIYNQDRRLMKRLKRTDTAPLLWSHEMLTERRTLDLTADLIEFMASNAAQVTQQHTLFCTYVKFGETHQQKADFTVVFTRQ